MALIALLMTGCIGEPGFMSTVPHWQPGEMPLAVCAQSYAADDDDGARAVTAQTVAESRRGWASSRTPFTRARPTNATCSWFPSSTA